MVPIEVPKVKFTLIGLGLLLGTVFFGPMGRSPSLADITPVVVFTVELLHIVSNTVDGFDGPVFWSRWNAFWTR